MIGGVIFGLIYIYNFIASTSDILYGVVNYLAMSWDTYRKWITVIFNEKMPDTKCRAFLNFKIIF